MICPKCEEYEFPDGCGAVSRVDNKTEICDRCGQIDAFAAVEAWRKKNAEEMPRKVVEEG